MSRCGDVPMLAQAAVTFRAVSSLPLKRSVSRLEIAFLER